MAPNLIRDDEPLCASCGNPIGNRLGGYWRNGGTEGPYHRLCVPPKGDCQGEVVPEVVSSPRRVGHLRVVK